MKLKTLIRHLLYIQDNLGEDCNITFSGFIGPRGEYLVLDMEDIGENISENLDIKGNFHLSFKVNQKCKETIINNIKRSIELGVPQYWELPTYSL